MDKWYSIYDDAFTAQTAVERTFRYCSWFSCAQVIINNNDMGKCHLKIFVNNDKVMPFLPTKVGPGVMVEAEAVYIDRSFNG